MRWRWQNRRRYKSRHWLALPSADANRPKAATGNYGRPSLPTADAQRLSGISVHFWLGINEQLVDCKYTYILVSCLFVCRLYRTSDDAAHSSGADHM